MKDPRRNRLFRRASPTRPHKATRDVQGTTKAKKGSLHTSHTKVPISGVESLPAKLHDKGCPFQHNTRHRRSLWSRMCLIDTNNGSCSCPKRQTGRSFAWKEKTSEVFGIQVNPLFQPRPNNPHSLISLPVAPGSGKPPINPSSRIFTYCNMKGKLMPLQIAHVG